MFITKTALPRRTFLRGVGAAVGLPLLEAMVPALTATAKTVATPKMRFGAVYIPHGAIMDQYTPRTAGRGFEFMPILKSLEPFRDSLMIVSNLDRPGDDDSHATASAAWLSGAIAKKTEGQDFYLGTTIDQIIAQKVGQETPFPSLEVATEDFTGYVGGCSPAYACAYMNTISWASPTNPLPMEINPRRVFEHLFGKPGTPQLRRARMEENRSILDSVAESAGALKKSLGARDQAKLADYMDSVREIERRIQRAEKTAADDVTLPDAPVGPPEFYPEHVAMLFDLIAVAFQADITRVFTFMMARDVSSRAFPQIGVPDPHHALSHESNRGNDPIKIEKFTKVNTYMVQMFAAFLQRLRSTEDGAGNLLDHSIVLYGSGMSNGNLHSHAPLPIVVLGGGDGRLKGNQHIVQPDLTPIENLHVSLAQRAGVELETFGRSTKPIDL
jgi:hypothetical protein